MMILRDGCQLLVTINIIYDGTETDLPTATAKEQKHQPAKLSIRWYNIGCVLQDHVE